MAYVIQVCWQLANCQQTLYLLYTQQWYMSYWFSDRLQAVSKPVCTVHTAMLYIILVFWQAASCQQTCMYCTHSNGICHTGLLTVWKLSANLYLLYTQQWYMSYRFADRLHVSANLYLLYTQQWYMSYWFANSLQSVSKPLFTVNTAMVYVILLCWQ